MPVIIDGTLGVNAAAITTTNWTPTNIATGGNTTLGDASGDTVTINASTVSIPNGLNFDSNTLAIDATNNRIGVGLSSPQGSLHVSGNSLISNPSYYTGTYYWTLSQSSSNGSFGINYYGQSNAVTITDTGYVGIGTSAPGSKLTISSAGAGAHNIQTWSSSIINPNNSGSEIIGSQITLGGNIVLSERQPNTAYSDRTDLVIVTDTGYGYGKSEKLRLTAGGLLGLGTSSPNRKLHVYTGNSGVTLDNAAGVVLENSTHQYIVMASTTNSQQGIIFSGGSFNDAGVIWEDGTRGNVLTLNNNGERLRIDSGGSVMIGSMSSPSSSATKLYVVTTSPADTTGNILLENTSTSSGAATNVQFLSKNKYGTYQFMGWEAYGLRIGSRSTANGGAGRIDFTSGNDAVTMSLDGNGNLGIGYTSPSDYSAKLLVNGSLYIPHTGYGAAGSTSRNTIRELKWGSYGRLQHSTFVNTAMLTWNAQLFDSDYVGSGSGTATNTNTFRPDYAAGVYGIMSPNNGGFGFNTGNWNNATSIEFGDLSTHSSFAGGVTNTGSWTRPKQPMFYAYGGSAPTSTGTIVWNSTRYNVGSGYNTSTGRFTAPTAGYYLVFAQMFFSADGANQVNVMKNGVGFWEIKVNNATNFGAYNSHGGANIIYLGTSDYIDVRFNLGSMLMGPDYSYFAAYLLG